LNFELLPNPAEDHIVIQLELDQIIEGLFVQIMDAQGRIVQNVDLSSDLSNQMELNINELESGIYFVNLISDIGFVTSKKFVKQ